MAQYKVVVIVRGKPVWWEAFLAMAPAGWQVVRADAFKSEKEVIEEVKDTDFLLCSGASHPNRIFPDEFVQSPRLRLIQTTGQGTDHLPMRLLLERGVLVANSGGANAIAVAEQTVLLMLAVMRKLLPCVGMIRQGLKYSDQVDRNDFHALNEKIVGIVGFGSIGQRVAKLVHGFDARIIIATRSEPSASLVNDLQAQRVSLEKLLSTADVISLHTPLLETTRRMIDWEQLCMMKPSAILINTSRGGVINEAALIRALQEKKIAGAGLDVFELEVPGPDNPLLSMANVVPTPHCGASTSALEAWPASRIKGIWDNYQRVLEGKGPDHNITSF